MSSDPHDARCKGILNGASSVPITGRRRFLAVGIGASIPALAGCATLSDFIGGLLLSDVNVFNEANHPVAGTIEVRDPDGSVVLDARFDLIPDGDNDDDGAGSGDDTDGDSFISYDNALTDAGQYALTVELAEEDAIDGENRYEGPVEVSDPETEHIVVALGADGADGPIDVAIVEEFTDIPEEFGGEPE